MMKEIQPGRRIVEFDRNAGLDFSGLISMECAFPSQSRCENLVRIDSVSTKVQVLAIVRNTRRLSLDREAFSAFYGRA